MLTNYVVIGVYSVVLVWCVALEKTFVECEKYMRYTIYSVDKLCGALDYSVDLNWCGAW